jgi:aldose 1-epimerase
MTADYRAEMTERDGIPACVLHDDSADLHGTWIPGAGMIAASLIHQGEELLWQGAGVAAYVRERKFMGIPFLYPWANRLDGFNYRCAGHSVTLDPSSGILKLDDNGLPIHGLLTADPHWSVQELTADGDGAPLTASFEFDRPELLAAFPFRHRLELEVTVAGGVVALKTTLIAASEQAVPVSFGFHPYLRFPGSPRADWKVSFSVRRHWLLDHRGIPTGATEPTEPLEGAIGDRTWDDAFDQIEPHGRFEIRGGERAISLHYTDGYPLAQIFAPPGEQYVCVEPMTALTNSLRGTDTALHWVRAGQRWSATFGIECAIET